MKNGCQKIRQPFFLLIDNSKADSLKTKQRQIINAGYNIRKQSKRGYLKKKLPLPY